MAGFFAAVADGIKRSRYGRRPAEPGRDTTPFPSFTQIGQVRSSARVVWKPTPRNLRMFSRTPYARRAINAIKNPIAGLEWEITPLPGVKESSELKRQIEIATYCLSNPNRDDSWRSLAEQVIEDVLVGAGAIEKRLSGDPLRPLWLYPVDGLSIQLYPGWSGDPQEARYTQSISSGANYLGGGQIIQLRDDELIYIRPNPSTSTPFGLGPLEVAFTSISRQLGVSEFAGNVTTNAKPSILLNVGEGADDRTLGAFRAYWTNEVEGQGKTPIMSAKNMAVERLFPEGDTGLFLKYQEFLKTEIAIAFDLSPQNLGVERDVNRSTAEVGEDRDWEQAIKPRARELSSYLTRQALHAALGFFQLQFRFIGLDRENEKLLAEIYKIEWEAGATTPNEYRETRGRAPLKNEFADKTGVDVTIATEAARGAAQVLDNDLPPSPSADSRPPKPKDK